MKGPEHAQRPTQQAALDPGRTQHEARALHAVARKGLSGPAGPYPYADRIKAAFGAHAPAGLAAHMGSAARSAGESLSAHGFVLGGRVAFNGMPSLHTAAHEAVHLVGQASRADRPRFGVGVHSDAAEAHANRVADAVVAGRSAEALLGAMPSTGGSGGGGDVLQMANKITINGGVATDTPWKQIGQQLPLKSGFDIDTHIKQVAPQFTEMINTLGDNCLQATTVTAEITGKATSHPRPADKTQTAYGTIGTFEQFITGAPGLTNYEFNGGHLVSDLVLGSASYVEGNFAPQRRYLNSPIYRKIEEIAEGGITYTGLPGGKPLNMPSHYMTATVSYPSVNHNVPSATIMNVLQIPMGDLTAMPPPNLTLRTWVPDLWRASVTAPQDHIMSHTSSVSPLDSAYQGFQANELTVLGLRGQTTQHIDSNYWSMDTFNVANSVVLNGRLTAPSQQHTYTATQSVPRAGLTTLNPGAPIIPPALPPPIPTVTTKLDLDDLMDCGLTEIDDIAQEFINDSTVDLGLTKTDLSDSMRTLRLLMSEEKGPVFKISDIGRFERRGAKKNRKFNLKMRLRLGRAHQTVIRNFHKGKNRKFKY